MEAQEDAAMLRWILHLLSLMKGDPDGPTGPGVEEGTSIPGQTQSGE